jgi:hypothetical protein
MNVDQPEASSSTSQPDPTMLRQATFVIDSTLSRDRYGKLVESDGVVHKLVQRLLEKHAESSVCARVNAETENAEADTS